MCGAPSFLSYLVLSKMGDVAEGEEQTYLIFLAVRGRVELGKLQRPTARSRWPMSRVNSRGNHAFNPLLTGSELPNEVKTLFPRHMTLFYRKGQIDMTHGNDVVQTSSARANHEVLDYGWKDIIFAKGAKPRFAKLQKLWIKATSASVGPSQSATFDANRDILAYMVIGE
jgi:hypothetical protein